MEETRKEMNENKVAKENAKQNSSAMVDINKVSKVYPNGVEALKNVSFSIERGEFVFLMGACGCGKTTLIKLLMLEERPTSGKIVSAKRDLSKIGRLRVSGYRQMLGVVFQDFKLIKKKTVFENVALALEIVGASRKTIKEKVQLALAVVGLEEKADRYPEELSGGEKQRVAVARAIVNSPEILLADEPTGNLDPDNSEELMRLFDEINSYGTT
ncbi:MAG: ATP-binding cassette domain-containing protein, partial [Clostridia bacterium]|nr:ATP-binding cassette domain-containing protein [Clostridia bacterium]